MVGPNFKAPHPAVPTAYISSAPATPYVTAGSVNPQWWNSFNDPELTSLETQAVAQNLDMQIATQRLIEAQAQAQIEGAVLYPNIGANASYSREGLSDKGVVQALGGGGGAGIPVAAVPPFD
ncbi:MAG: TolC family protein, partial [Acidocella sp.]|nr:TolC family protein [Acidocella sp.]